MFRGFSASSIGAATAVGVLFLSGGLGCDGSAPEEPAGAVAVREVSPEQVLELGSGQGGALVLDVRTPSEYESGHVPGAVNIPHTELAARLDELTDGRERGVVVYCERGGRAGVAAGILREHGFGDIGHLVGDMSGWRNAGLPTEP